MGAWAADASGKPVRSARMPYQQVNLQLEEEGEAGLLGVAKELFWLHGC